MSWNRRHARNCKGKHRHSSKGAAEAHARGIARRYPEEAISIRPYPCPHCQGWHVGHVKKGQAA